MKRRPRDNYSVSICDTGRTEYNVHPLSPRITWPLLARDLRIGYRRMMEKIHEAIRSEAAGITGKGDLLIKIKDWMN